MQKAVCRYLMLLMIGMRVPSRQSDAKGSGKENTHPVTHCTTTCKYNLADETNCFALNAAPHLVSDSKLFTSPVFGWTWMSNLLRRKHAKDSVRLLHCWRCLLSGRMQEPRSTSYKLSRLSESEVGISFLRTVAIPRAPKLETH